MTEQAQKPEVKTPAKPEVKTPVKPIIKKAAEAKPSVVEKKEDQTVEQAKAKAVPVVSGKQATWTEIMNTSRGLRPDGSKRVK